MKMRLRTILLKRKPTHTHTHTQFADAQQYERSMRMPIGAAWNTAVTHNKAIQPKVPN